MLNVWLGIITTIRLRLGTKFHLPNEFHFEMFQFFVNSMAVNHMQLFERRPFLLVF